MADAKISGLPTADPLDGTEKILISQDGADAQVDLATLREDLRSSSGSRQFLWPGLTKISNTISFQNRTTLDASGEYHAVVCQAVEDMALSHVGFRTNGATGSPTAEIRIETVDASTGLPTGTLWDTNTNVTTGTLTAATFAMFALTATATIPKGSIFAVKVQYASGTSFVLMDFPQWSNGGGYSVVNTGTPTIGSDFSMCWGLGSSATQLYQMRSLLPVSGASGETFNNTNGARRGAKFQIPFGCRLLGARVYGGSGASSGDFNFGIWDDAGNEVGSSITSRDASHFFNQGVAYGNELIFDNPPNIAANTNYRFALEPTSSTNVSFSHLTVTAAGLRSGLPGGARSHLTTYTTGGGWVDTATTSVPTIDFIVEAL
jgi:hypothetical protein